MSDKAGANSDGRFRFIDLLVILFCLSGAVFTVNLFRLDLFRTLDANGEEPVGTIIIKNNIVQRRMSNRVLWDRLVVDSPAYNRDLVRTADLSSAMLFFESNSIDLNEKTIIRIQRSSYSDSFQVDLEEGNIGVTTGTGGGNMVLNLMGHQVEVGYGSILNATAGEDGIAVQVSEGAASFISNGQRREIFSGGMIALDSEGTERIEKAAVVIRPRPNARYLKNTPEPVNINFAWSRINLDSGETIRMEIAEDRNFIRIVRVIENLNTAADLDLGAGIWYWRLSLTEAGDSRRFLSSERFVVAEATGPALLSPVTDSLIRYHDNLPRLRFQWSRTEEASSYILEVSDNPDFMNPRLNVQTTSVFLLNSSFGQGTWYWRVMPVFPSAYEGSAAFSPAAFFRIEQGGSDDVGLVLPVIQREPVIEQAPEPVIELPEPVPVRISLLSPSQGTSLPGLTALRQQTVFSWDSDGEMARSRFVLSRNSNPLTGRPMVEIINPNRTVRLNRLEEGVYYWTVEAQSPEGLISAAGPRQLRVLPIPLLPAPGNMQPLTGHLIGIDYLREAKNIAFTWSAVQGANAYVFTLYHDTVGGRRLIIRRPAENRTNWTLDDLTTLGRGTFVWQVEAVNRNSGGTIEQRGRIGENSFVIDIPRPGQVQIENPGTLYGF
jgi:hypothetical protein